MASKLTAADSSGPARQSDVTSKVVRDNTTNHKNKINELVDEIAAAAIGTTNAETTAARPYNTNLKERLDQIWDGQYNFVSTGGIVSINGGDAQKVDVTAFTGTLSGIQVKISGATSATVAFTSSDTRYDVVVANSDSTFTVVTGTEDADPVLPSVASTQKALWVLLVGTATVALNHDARDQGCFFQDEGKIAFGWKIQDAIDAITTGTIFIGKGKYYEEADLTGKSDIELIYSDGAEHYRPNDTDYCIKSVNGSGTEEEGIKIIGGNLFGNSKTGAIELLKFQYTDEFVIQNTTFDSNASSSATNKNYVIDNCDIGFINTMETGGNDHSITNCTSINIRDTINSAGAASNFLKETIYTSDDTWTVPASVTIAHFYIVGGGAGGGGGGGGFPTNLGGGGGGGGASRGQILFLKNVTVTPAASVTITVGAAGTGGAGGVTTPADGVDGVDGGNSSVVVSAVTYTALGGNKGLKGIKATSGAGGAGGVGAAAEQTGGAGGTAGNNGVAGQSIDFGGGGTGGDGTNTTYGGGGGGGGGVTGGIGANGGLGGQAPDGGDGTNYGTGGGGGGGGSAALFANAGGTGGDGGAGIIRVIYEAAS